MTERDTSSSKGTDEVEEEKRERSEPLSADTEERDERRRDVNSSDEGPSIDPFFGHPGFQPEQVSWSRVGLGLAVIAALHSLIAFITYSSTLYHQPMLTISLGVIPYVAGGLLLGGLSRRSERSLLDPFYSAVGPALILPFVIELMRVSTTNPPDVAQTMARVQWLAVLAPVMVYVLVALFGCWLGERLWPRKGRYQ